MAGKEKIDKEHYGITQENWIFANCQEEIVDSQAQHKEIQHKK